MAVHGSGFLISNDEDASKAMALSRFFKAIGSDEQDLFSRVFFCEWLRHEPFFKKNDQLTVRQVPAVGVWVPPGHVPRLTAQWHRPACSPSFLCCTVSLTLHSCLPRSKAVPQRTYRPSCCAMLQQTSARSKRDHRGYRIRHRAHLLQVCAAAFLSDMMALCHLL